MVGGRAPVDGVVVPPIAADSEDGGVHPVVKPEAIAVDGEATSLVARLLRLATDGRFIEHCRYCDARSLSRWGKTPKGHRRWKCRACGRSFCATTGTMLAGLRSLDKLALVMTDMLGAAPRSCRSLAAELEVERMTIWRWRLLIGRSLLALQARLSHDLVETARLELRESRKASREWVDHRRDPLLYPAPDRLRWIDYRLLRLALPEPMMPHLVPLRLDRDAFGQCFARIVADRPDAATPDPMVVNAVADPLRQDTPATAEQRLRSRQGMESDPMASAETIAAESASVPLITRLRQFLAPFCGPATRHLPAYLAWFAACQEPSPTNRLERIWQRLHA